MEHLSIPQSDEGLGIVWRYMRLRHALGVVFGWRMSDSDIVVLTEERQGMAPEEDA